MKKIKIKDLSKNMNLVGCKLNGKFIVSGWKKGFWLKKSENSSNVTPIFFKDFKEIENWEIEIPDNKLIG